VFAIQKMQPFQHVLRLAEAMGPPIIQFPLTCAEINNMIGIGDNTIKRSRYRNR
jgi:hypothetical protein